LYLAARVAERSRAPGSIFSGGNKDEGGSSWHLFRDSRVEFRNFTDGCALPKKTDVVCQIVIDSLPEHVRPPAMQRDLDRVVINRSGAIDLNTFPVNEAERLRLEQICNYLTHADRPVRVQFSGPPGAEFLASAQLLSAHIGVPLFQLNLPLLLEPIPDRFEQLLASAFARVSEQNGALLLLELEAWRTQVDPWRRARVELELERFGGLIVFADERAPESRDPQRLDCVFDRLTYSKRESLWRTELPAERQNLAGELAGRYAFTSGQIRNASLRAQTEGRLRGEVPAEADYRAGCSAESRHSLKELALKIELVFTWDDLILPETTREYLRDLVVRATRREEVHETWGFRRKLPYGAGINALFYGASGTGKTMAAAVIARELGRELYRTEMSRVVSRYIGETEKNLARIFEEARHSNAILMFDEADALFAKRTEIQDAHDRYANLETAYLLQEIERYSGLCILATNLPANMDDAFRRRLHMSVSFPTPDPDTRLRLLESFFPPEAPVGSDVDLRRIANGAELSGGGLKNIVLTAAFYASGEGNPILMKYLLGAARIECAKEGRAFAG
jgi:ATPase family associated with various cellular activities (AAA)